MRSLLNLIISQNLLLGKNRDYRNRLTNVRVNDRTGRLTRSDSFVYDALDRRIAKTVDPDGADFLPAFTEHFIYQGDNLHLVFDDRGNLTYRFLFGPGSDQI